MKHKFIISLQNRLALTYAFLVVSALIILTIIINIFTRSIFAAHVKNNIAKRSAEIVSVFGEQYMPMSRAFDAAAIEVMGMYFVHEGYIVTVEDLRGGIVWDARSCDMQECIEVINGITSRMEGHVGRNGGLRKEQYPLWFANQLVGTVRIETYGPFFYSETETKFIASVNRLLVSATFVLTLFIVVVSLILSRAIARPVNKSAGAARLIAQTYGSGAARIAGGTPPVKIENRYHTKELAELAASINELAAELAEGERRQKQLTFDIAHELRTPLACLQGDIEAMIDGVYQPDRERLESCHEEIIRLAALVRDLQTLTALEWEDIKLDKTEFDLAQLLRVTEDQFHSAALAKGICINLNLTESPIAADYDRLKQVFINLLSNAIKYTDKGNITISVEKSSCPGTAWSVSIADTGIGIPETALSHVFERFYRVDKSRSRDSGGAGIGLAIAAAIVHAHGGSITAAGNGQGSVFKVVL